MRHPALPIAAIVGLALAPSILAEPPGDDADRMLRSPHVNHDPGPEYSDEARDYGMILGMERTAKGRLWMAWIAGGDSEKGLAVVARSDDDGKSWSKPVLVIDPADVPGLPPIRVLVGNLWSDPRGRLWFFFDYSIGYFDGRAGTWAIVCDDPDAARPAWSAPHRIWHGAVLNKPTVLESGEWLLPISLWDRAKIKPRPEAGSEGGFPELDPFRMLNVFASTDEGATWRRRGGVRIPNPSFDEATIVERRDGELWLLARSSKGIMESRSDDRGATWSAARPPEGIRHLASRHMLRRLRSGKLLLVKHGREVDEAPSSRTDLTAFLSDDDGRTWSGGLLLDDRKSVSYPDGVEAPDGTIYVCYDRERSREREILMARFREADVLAGEPVTPGAELRILVNKATGRKPRPASPAPNP